MVDVTLALNLTRFLRKETTMIPWEAALKNLRYFIHMLEHTEAHGPMQAGVGPLLAVTCCRFGSHSRLW